MRLIYWTKIILSGFLIVILLILFTGITFEQYSRYEAKKRYPPEGEFFNVDGHQIHMVKKGNSGPTVLFESGADPLGHLTWYKVQDEISKYAVTVSYDRSGILWSERGKNPKTAKAMAEELHTLLNVANINKPFIYVGHSLAGLIIRSYMSLYPKDVSDIVFVEATNPTQYKRLGPGGTAPPLWFLDARSYIGYYRLHYVKPLPDDFLNEKLNALPYRSTTTEEMTHFHAMSDEVSNIDSFGSTPLIVISGGSWQKHLTPDKKTHDLWIEMQMELLKLSTNSTYVVADDSGHFPQLDQPDIVIEAIKGLITN